MKLTHLALLAGPLASALSFNTFAGDLVSVQFSDGRPTVSGVEAVNKALNPIGVNVVAVDIPDAARPLLEASHRRALTKAEHGTLIAAFNLTDNQAEAILNMRLLSLRKLEEIELRQEHKTLTEEKGKLEALLASDKRQWGEIAKQV